MTDWKHARPYPLELARAEHDKRSEAADLLALLLAVCVLSFWAGYELASEHRTDQAAAISGAPTLSTIQPCPESDAGQDIIEHSWSHRGELFYRECHVVARPIDAQPNYARAQPRTRM